MRPLDSRFRGNDDFADVLSAPNRWTTGAVIGTLYGRQTGDELSADSSLVAPRYQGDKAIRIYIGNLPYQVTEDEIRNLFTHHGEVGSVELPWDERAGRPKGFGFIEMPDATQANAAVAALNSFELGGRKIVVNEARPMTPRSGPPRGGGEFRSSSGPKGRGGSKFRSGDREGKSSWDRSSRRRR